MTDKKHFITLKQRLMTAFERVLLKLYSIRKPLPLDNRSLLHGINDDLDLLTRYKRVFNNNEGPVFSLKYGDILNNTGDLLLCPITERRLFNNALFRRIYRRDRNILHEWLGEIMPGGDRLYTSDHCVYLPLRKLNYRGVIFVWFELLSENEQNINTERAAEALSLASRFNCCKLTIPNIFNDNVFFPGRRLIESVIKGGGKTDFTIECILSGIPVSDLYHYYHKQYLAVPEKYPKSGKLRRDKQRFPVSSYYLQEYAYNKKEISKTLDVLTKKHVKENQICSLISFFINKVGISYETGVCRGNKGYAQELSEFLSEYPWNKDKIDPLMQADPPSL